MLINVINILKQCFLIFQQGIKCLFYDINNPTSDSLGSSIKQVDERYRVESSVTILNLAVLSVPWFSSKFE